MLNKTINEITAETLVEWYNVIQYSLQTTQNKLKIVDDSLCHRISQMTALSDKFIQDFKTKLDWNWISTNLPPDQNFIEEFQVFIKWDSVSQYQTLSEEFIRDFQDKVNWQSISRKQNLSED